MNEMKHLELKYARAEIKAVGDVAGQFEALVSIFNNVDYGNDRVLPGAFSKTLEEWAAKGDPMPVIWSHEWDDPTSHIGIVVDAKEVPEGLWVRAQLDVEHNPKAAYVARLLKERRVTQFSFGYQARDFQYVTEKDGTTIRELFDLDVFEVGPTLLGMNPATQLLNAASRTMTLAGSKATAAEIADGVFVSFEFDGDTTIGRIEHVMTEGFLGVQDSPLRLEASPEDPAVLVRVFEDEGGVLIETEVFVGRLASDVTVIDPPAATASKSAMIETKVASPAWMRENARQGLDWYEQGLAGDGVVAATIREARDIAGGNVTDEKARKMAAWFARHMVDLDAPAADPGHENYPSPGVVAHALWGGGSKSESERAFAWAQRRVEQLNREEGKDGDEESKDVDAPADTDSRDTPTNIVNNNPEIQHLLTRPKHTEE